MTTRPGVVRYEGHQYGTSWLGFAGLAPAVIRVIFRLDDGLHITYTWKRKKIRYVRIPLSEVPV